MTGEDELQEILDFGLSLAINSGRIARKYFRSALTVSSKSEISFDPVTEADRKIEQFLSSNIKQTYPQHSIVGEEFGTQQGNRYTWIIDPIDGTRGFITGTPMWGSLIGFMEESQPLMGIMHQPFIRETFYADNKNSWYKSGKTVRKITCRDTEQIDQAILFCTHPAMFSQKSDAEAFSRIESMARFSRFGSDCYGYCLLAAGFVDIVIEAGLQAFDIIPLIPVIESAGGVVSCWDGSSALDGGNIIAAANPKLHEKVLSLLNM
jgi:myo-inositol-1(or 4)-monophosphatase